MREYGQVQCAIWTDPEIQSLSDKAVLLITYLLTGPHSNGLGCYRLPDGYIQADRGWSAADVKKSFSELEEIGFAVRCEMTGFVLIRNFLKWNPISNGNVARARQKEFETVPKKASFYKHLIEEVLANGSHFDDEFRRRIETLYQTLSDGSLGGYAEQDPTLPNQEQEKTQQETYCAEPQSDSTPEAVISVPLNDGSEYGVTQEQVDEWAKLFPAVDVLQTIRSMVAWSKANPAKRKTRKGVLRFVTGWLAREQDKGGRHPPPSAHGGFDNLDYSSGIGPNGEIL